MNLDYNQPDVADKMQFSPSVNFWEVGSDVLPMTEGENSSKYMYIHSQ